MKTITTNSTAVTVINGKSYKVTHVFNMVGNWYFTDKHGTQYLVDGEDVSQWVEESGAKFDGVYSAIGYARGLAEQNNGEFWWKVKQHYDDEQTELLEKQTNKLTK